MTTDREPIIHTVLRGVRSPAVPAPANGPAAPSRRCRRQDGRVLRDFPVPLGPRSARPGPAPTGASTGEPPVPRPSASVLLISDGRPDLAARGPGEDPEATRHGSGVWVYTFRRTAQMAFAAGMLVFPGGAVEPGDDELVPAENGSGLTDRHVAAVRETFEECGVLLAVPVDGRSAPSAARLAELRTDLLAGRVGLGDVLAAVGMRLDGMLLHAWARWVTPLVEPRRFDTTFFVAALPAGQQVGPVAGEGERAQWRRAAEAVAEHRAGRLAMLPPTLVCLEELAAAGDVAELLATARVVRPVCPWQVGVAAADLPDADRGGGPPDGEQLVVRVDLDGRGGGEPGPGQPE